MAILRLPWRKRAVDYPPLSDNLWSEVAFGRSCLLSLTGEDALRLRSLASWFLEDRAFRSVAGATPDDSDRASIALLACLPILNLGEGWYRDWKTIVLEPDGFVHRMETIDSAGVVNEYDDELSGRVTEMGPVILSLRDVRESGFGDGYDVVIHEMAHKLDERDGCLDGVPPLRRGMSRRRWQEAFSLAFNDLRTRARKAGGRRGHTRGKRLPMDEYAAESPEEFFAVACEHFFGTPERLMAAYPDVYRLLSEFFMMDPRMRTLPGMPGKIS